MKKETLEEAAEKYKKSTANKMAIEKIAFEKGYTECMRKMYSEEEVLALIHKRMIYTLGDNYQETTTLKWFEQFKKK